MEYLYMPEPGQILVLAGGAGVVTELTVLPGTEDLAGAGWLR
jgi:hypothetical protein